MFCAKYILFLLQQQIDKKKKKALSSYYTARTGLLCFKESICSHYNPFLLISVVYLNFTVTSTQNPHLETLLACNPELFLENIETNAKYNT